MDVAIQFVREIGNSIRIVYRHQESCALWRNAVEFLECLEGLVELFGVFLVLRKRPASHFAYLGRTILGRLFALIGSVCFCSSTINGSLVGIYWHAPTKSRRTISIQPARGARSSPRTLHHPAFSAQLSRG